MAEVKTLGSVDKGTTGAFLVMTANMAASTSIAMFAGNSGAMVPGHESKVISVDFEEIGGTNPPRAGKGGQIFYAGDQGYELAKEGEILKAVTIRFESGRTMTLGLLLQGGQKSNILFKGDTAPTKAIDIKLEDISAKFLNKTFKCITFNRDESNMIQRPAIAGQAARAPYPANVYEFVETTP
jgi:hypothetical protein